MNKCKPLVDGREEEGGGAGRDDDDDEPHGRRVLENHHSTNVEYAGFGASLPALSADAWPATPYGHST